MKQLSIRQKLFSVLLVFFLLVAVMPTIVKADALNDCLADSTKSVADCMKISQDALAGSSGYNTTDPAAGDLTTFVQNLVLGALSVVGTIFFIYMFYGGYLWFTSGGNEEQINQAKSAIRNGIIGIAVVLGAFSITAFVLNMFL
jgi:hypothetical protein